MSLLGLLVFAPGASGAHHLVLIREVSPGTTANPTAEFVELQLTANNENQVANQAIVRLYNASGTMTNSAMFTSNPPNPQSQRRMLAATATAGATPDLVLPTTDALGPAGTACFDSMLFGPLDCVTWGAATAPAGRSSC